MDNMPSCLCGSCQPPGALCTLLFVTSGVLWASLGCGAFLGAGFWERVDSRVYGVLQTRSHPAPAPGLRRGHALLVADFGLSLVPSWQGNIWG